MRTISLPISPNSGIRSKRIHGFIVLLFCIGFLGACAPKTLYYWGNYEDCLYNNNLKSDPEEAFNILSETITEAEKAQNVKLAPGLYAEYGFMLYKQGKIDEAAKYFSMESEAFPESEPLMNKLIARINEPEKINNDDLLVEESNPEFSPESDVEIQGGER